MNCNEARQHWNLYYDSEGDAELHFRIGKHLGMCPECAQWFAQQSRFENLLGEKLASPPTAELWSQVLGRCGLLAKPARARRRAWLVACAACAAAVVVVAFWLANRLPPSPEPDLAKLTAAWHQRLVDGRETVQFPNESDLAVEHFLRDRVTFPVRCPPRKDAGFAVQGAGIGRLAEQPTAYLSGQVGDAPVSIFVLPRDSLAAFPQQQEALRQEKTHRCQEGEYAMILGVIDRNAVLVVGRTQPASLEKVLKAYGSYPDQD